MFRSILFIFILLVSTTTSALEYRKFGGTFSIDGEIKQGDFIKMLKKLATWEVAPTIFYITSPGGDVDEAMNIGRFIRATQIPLYTGPECSSACVFIYASAVVRHVGMDGVAIGKLGLHRPYFDPAHFADLESLEAKQVYDDLRVAVSDFLKEMDVSQSVIERIFLTGSQNIDYLNEDEADIAFGTTAPFYDEWLTAKCGKLTAEQSNVIKSWSNLEAARMTVIAMESPNLPKSEDFGQNLESLIKGSQLAFQLEKAGMLKPYIDASETYNTCKEKTVNHHINSFHLSVKKHLNALISRFTVK